MIKILQINIRITLTLLLLISGTFLSAQVTGSLGLTCGGDGTVSASPIGGTWVSSDPTVATITSLTGDYETISPGSCVFTYSHPCCGVTATFDVTVYEGEDVNLIASEIIICQGESVTLTASGADSYLWGGGLGTGATKVVSPLTTTTYSVTGTSGAECAGDNTANITVTVNPLPVINAGPDQEICEGESITLTASGAGIGGSYSWSDGVVDGVSFDPPTTNTYTVTGTDANGCQNSDEIEVTVNPIPVINAGPDQEICEGESITLTASGAGIGGSYSWSDGVVDGVSFDPPSTNTYTVTGTDANGCQNSDEIEVTVNPIPVINAGPDQEICEGESITLTASGAGIGGSYSWSDGVVDGVSFDPPSTNTYMVTGTDANGCQNSDELEVTVNPLPVINAGLDQEICEGESITLTASGAGIGGSYSWSDGVVDGVSFDPPSTNTYTVTGTDANGCQNSDEIEVTVNPLPVINAGPDQEICEGESIILTASGAGIGGSYSWSDGVVDGVSFDPPSTNTYTVTGTDANGCQNSDELEVTVNPLPVINAGPDQEICEGESITLTASGAGIGGSYSWSDGVVDGVSFDPPSTNTYTVTGTDANGCQNSDELEVTVNPLPVINAGLDQEICEGESITLTASGAGIGGSYSWSDGVVDGVSFDPPSTNTYTVTGTDANGCQNSDEIEVTVNPLPVINAGPDQEICEGESIILTASGAGIGGSYSWSDGVVDGVSFDPPSTNTYTVTGTDANGCQNSDELEVTVNPLPVINAGPDQEICEGESITLTASGAGIGGSYSWSDGVVDGVSFDPPSTNTYTVTGTDANGCQNSDELEVTVNPLPVINAGPDQEICEGESITLTASGAGIGGSYSWSDGVVDGVSFDPPTTNTYMVTGTDANGCQNSDELEVSVFTEPPVEAGSDFAICFGEGVILNGTGAGVEGTYTWTGGVVNNEEFFLTNTVTLILTGTTIGGCENSDTLTIVVNPLPNYDNSLIDHEFIVCGNGNDTIQIGNELLDDLGYDLLWSPSDAMLDATTGTPFVWPVASTLYYLFVTDSITGCAVKDSVLVKSIDPDGLKIVLEDDYISGEEEEFGTINIYSNDIFEPIGDFNVNLMTTSSLLSVDFEPESGLLNFTLLNDGTDQIDYEICHEICLNKCDTAIIFIDIDKSVDFAPGNYGISPNYDNNGDLLHFEHLEYFDWNEIKIYNRWGDQVFTTENYTNNFAGKNSNGLELSEGTYFYVLKVLDNDEESTFNGFIEIIR